MARERRLVRFDLKDKERPYMVVRPIRIDGEQISNPDPEVGRDWNGNGRRYNGREIDQLFRGGQNDFEFFFESRETMDRYKDAFVTYAQMRVNRRGTNLCAKEHKVA